MWFVSKKKYDTLLEQKKDYERLAFETIQLNGRVISNNEKILQEMKSIQELNHNLTKLNDELLAHCKELEAKLNFVIKQRDYYYELLEDTSEVGGEAE